MKTQTTKPDLKRLLVVAGGTGGHIFPAKAVARAAKAAGCDVLCVGTDGDLEREHLSQDFDFIALHTSGLRGKKLMSRGKALWQMGKAFLQSLRLLKQYRPQVVLCMGGYVTVPVALAAWCRRIPIVLHEQNAVAGKSNVYLSRLARCVLQAFPNSFSESVAVQTVGNPVRASFLQQPLPAERFAVREAPCRLLVVGGSQGAHALNDLCLAMVRQLAPDQSLLLRHQTGASDYVRVSSAYQALTAGTEGIEVMPFIDDMASAYAWADVVLCRAGALTVAEICAVGLPAFFVPFPSAVDDHQSKNAAALVQLGAAKMQQQADLSAAQLWQTIKPWMDQKQQRLQMAQIAYQAAKRDSVEKIMQACCEALLLPGK